MRGRGPLFAFGATSAGATCPGGASGTSRGRRPSRPAPAKVDQGPRLLSSKSVLGPVRQVRVGRPSQRHAAESACLTDFLVAQRSQGLSMNTTCSCGGRSDVRAGGSPRPAPARGRWSPLSALKNRDRWRGHLSQSHPSHFMDVGTSLTSRQPSR